MTIVFDFDGTLADSLSVILSVYNELAPKWGTQKVTRTDWYRLRQIHWRQVVKELGVKPYRVPAMLAEGKRLMQSHAHEIELFPGVPKMINQLAEQSHELFILSTNAGTLVHKVLDKHGLSDQIHVLRSPKHFGKAQALRRFLRQHQVNRSDVWMVGDEVRDAVAARKNRVRFLAVTWGFQPETVLARENSTAIARQPADITVIINA